MEASRKIDLPAASYTPPDSGHFSATATPSSTAPARLILADDPGYLAWMMESRIYYHHPCDPFPNHVAGVLDIMARPSRSRGPSIEELRRDRALIDLTMRPPKQVLKSYVDAYFFPTLRRPEGPLKRIDGQRMAWRTLPASVDLSRADVPAPECLFGYSHTAFSPRTIAPNMGPLDANDHGLLCPFLVLELQDDTRQINGNLWEATKKLLAASASCVDMLARLNRRLRESGAGDHCLINPAVFSIAMSGTEARLFVAWKDVDDNYHMQAVATFLLQSPQLWLDFRKFVWNILDWAQDVRLTDIDAALRILNQLGS
ncbi:hypothetical protein BT67DRAFT_316310 [Trichocladium antarcticum]|uniref:DUF7924 domain-containing protein n=1 Tax=Trichocladium antarcticum TaxID=1450529 RepID=A0AAN6UJV9_9PEZI|nr:hypothetical protein BT67DRAFT_316310 [Trichocladium antarcticum]